KSPPILMAVRIVVPTEVTPGERRVSLVPDVVKQLTKAGVEVVVEAGAGASSGYPDALYTAVGAQTQTDRSALFGSAAIVLKVQAPTPEEIGWMKPGTVVVALMNASRSPDRAANMRDAKATAAGYRAMLMGASLAPKFLPMLTAAAGTIRPAKVLILGAGVAGLFAIAT